MFLALESGPSAQLINLLKEAFLPYQREQRVLLVAHDLRSPIRTLLFDEFNHVPVLSFAELMGTAKVKVLGRLDFEGDSDEHEADF